MKTPRISTKWLNNLAFEGEVNGHKIIIDADETIGGQDQGARPKPLMQLALAGCTGIDVVSILNKMKVQFDDFQIHIESDMTEEHPKHYSKMHIIYEFTGKDLDYSKLEKAVNLSQEKYCGVSFMYKQFLTLTHEIVIK